MELVQKLSFSDRQSFKVWLDQFVLQKGFNYKVRNSETSEGIVRRVSYVCAKSGTYNPNVTVEPIKRHTTHLNKQNALGN